MVEGYNITLKVNDKTLCGRTQDDLNVQAVIKESLTKDDQGESQKQVTGHNVSFSVSGLIEVGNEEATKLDRDDVMELSLKTGDDAIVPCKYLCAKGDTYGGNAIIAGYTESSNSEDIGTYGLDLQISGAFTKQV